MGLPQVSSSETSEVARSLSTFVDNHPRFSSKSTSDLEELHVESMRQTLGGSVCSSLGDFHMKNSSPLTKIQDNLPKKGTMDASTNFYGLKIGSKDNLDLLTPNTSQNLQMPVSRVVGFESSRLNSSFDAFDEVSHHQVYSSVVGITTDELDSSGSLAKKRVLSPLNAMLFPEKFCGDSLDLSCKTSQINPHATSYSCSAPMVQDYKKANIGIKNYFTAPTWSVSNYSEQNNACCDYSKTASILFTDGPVLEELLPHTCLSSPGLESSEVRSKTGTSLISSVKGVSPPLSMSPLGPKIYEKKKAEGCRKERGDYLALKNVEQSLDQNVSGIIFASEEEDFRMASKSFEDTEFFHRQIQCSSSEGNSGTSWPFYQDLAISFSTHCAKSSTSLRGLPVRRSLVGSFEESLLSGHLSSGKLSQVNFIS